MNIAIEQILKLIENYRILSVWAWFVDLFCVLVTALVAVDVMELRRWQKNQSKSIEMLHSFSSHPDWPHSLLDCLIVHSIFIVHWNTVFRKYFIKNKVWRISWRASNFLLSNSKISFQPSKLLTTIHYHFATWNLERHVSAYDCSDYYVN